MKNLGNLLNCPSATVRTVEEEFGGRGERVISGSLAFVAMKKSANFRERDDITLIRRLNPPELRGVFVQNQVRPPVISIWITWCCPA